MCDLCVLYVMTDYCCLPESLRSAMASWCPVSTEFRFCVWNIWRWLMEKPPDDVERGARSTWTGNQPTSWVCHLNSICLCKFLVLSVRRIEKKKKGEESSIARGERRETDAVFIKWRCKSSEVTRIKSTDPKPEQMSCVNCRNRRRIQQKRIETFFW